MSFLEFLIQLDQQITLWINSLNSPATSVVWPFLSDTRIWFPAYGMIAIVAFWKLGWKKGLVVVLSLVLCIILTDKLSVLVKHGAERLRPFYDSNMLANGLKWPYGADGRHFGFFSSHASNTFGFALASSLGFSLNDKRHNWKPYTVGIFIWATVVSLSRVMMAAHYFGDVLVGSLFGMAIGFFCAMLGRLVIVKAKL